MAEVISLDQARERVEEHAGGPLAVETVAIDAGGLSGASALGRHLACEVRADGPWPATDRSAMDGFGVAFAGDAAAFSEPVPVVGECLAGHPWDGELAPGQAVRIMTGAVVPATVSAVVPVENTSGYGGETVEIRGEVARGANIRPAGSEVSAGALLMAPGRRLRAAEIGVLAVLGMAEVPVHRRPRVAILATGDEVVPVDQVPAPHQVRNSNAHALAAQVVEAGGVPIALGIARDEAGDLEQRLRRGLEDADVVLTIGGVSKGTHDLVHGTLAALGVAEVFHGIALKPGKPSYFGVRGERDERRWVFGLPGNPTSCFTVFDLLVRPLLERLQGRAPEAAERHPVGGAPFRKNWRLQAVPAALALGAGRAVLELQDSRPSGDPFSLLGGVGYALIPGDTAPGTEGDVEFVGFASGTGRP